MPRPRGASGTKMAAELEYESVLCVKPDVSVYRIPPRASNRGYRYLAGFAAGARRGDGCVLGSTHRPEPLADERSLSLPSRLPASLSTFLCWWNSYFVLFSYCPHASFHLSFPSPLGHHLLLAIRNPFMPAPSVTLSATFGL